nr:immunoglobulin heavy chain junction region [Macaca mulatta]
CARVRYYGDDYGHSPGRFDVW